MRTQVAIYLLIYSLNTAHVRSTDSQRLDTLDLKLAYVKIPAQQTYYVCQQFKVPSDKPYHVVKFEPLINNTEMVHHLLVFGCEFDMETKDPHPCDSIDNNCHTWLVKWDVGMHGVIDMPTETGVRFGKGSYSHMLLQIHWNNKDVVDNATDQSGMRLHYTSDLRKFDVGNVQVGQNEIAILPEMASVAITGRCASRCTAQMLPRTIYLSDVYMHMHGLGTQAALDIVRDREVTSRIAFEDYYNYTSPITHILQPAFEVRPGDEIKLTCWYDTKTGSRLRNQTISFGQGSNAEMCYAFIRYYPRIVGFDQCIQSKERGNTKC